MTVAVVVPLALHGMVEIALGQGLVRRKKFDRFF